MENMPATSPGVERTARADPSVWGLVGISALISFGAALPVMLFLAVAAAAVAALAAAVVGVPIAALARRWRIGTAWEAAGLGLGAALVAGGVAGWATGLAAFSSPVRPDFYLTSMTLQFAVIAAPFGVTAALVYWSRYISRGWASKNVVTIAAVLVLMTAVIFAANHEIR